MANYFWVVDFTSAGRPIVIKGRSFSNELRAQRYIDDSSLSRRAEVFELTSTSEAEATRELKAILVRRYKSLDKGITRAVHK